MLSLRSKSPGSPPNSWPECSRRLAKIPGIGPIGAALLMMKTPAPELFRSGRQFAAWIGLTPRDHSTAGKVKLGVITRAGDEALRAVLVSGATAVIRHAVGAKDAHRPGSSTFSSASRRRPMRKSSISLVAGERYIASPTIEAALFSYRRCAA